jgi:hypothetical protein
MKKESLGGLIILAGIGLIGFIWFKRNKPTTADKQLADLNALSTSLKVGSTGDLDKPFEYTEEQKQNAGRNPYTNSFYSDKEVKDWYKNMTPAELEALKKSIGNIPDPSAIVSNQIALNMQNVDFSKLGNISFTNIKV